MQGVEGVEELLLRGFLARQKLDIVDQQHVGLTVFLAELLGRGGLNGGDDLVGEHLAVHIHDVEIGVVLFDLDLNGVQQVGLAQTRRAVDEQRVVGTAGVGGHGLRGGVGKLVAGAFDEVFKGKVVPSAGQGTFVQLGLFFFALVLFGGDEQHLDIKAQNGLKGVLQKGGIAVGHNAQDKGVADLQRDGVGVFKADRLDVTDVILIRRLGGMFAAVRFGRVQYVVDGIHSLRYPHFLLK